MSILGIDPGASGAIVVLYDPLTVEAIKLDNTERDIRDFLVFHTASSHTIKPFCSVHAYIERVHAWPEQGVSSTFKFGVNYGFLRGCLIALEIPFEEVTPHKWQAAMGCLSGGKKNVTKARAQQLFPQMKITHAIADALLIAEYGRRLKSGELNDSARK